MKSKTSSEINKNKIKTFKAVTPLRVVKSNTALKLKADEDFDDKTAGDEWLFEGPGKTN